MRELPFIFHTLCRGKCSCILHMQAVGQVSGSNSPKT